MRRRRDQKPAEKLEPAVRAQVREPERDGVAVQLPPVDSASLEAGRLEAKRQ